MANFQRTKFYAYVKLGSKQKSKRVYRRARGRHNKTRQKWRSRPPMVEIGYKNKVTTRGLIQGKIPILVHNLTELQKVGKENVVILSKVGNKNKMIIVKEAHTKKIPILNLNINKYLKEMERKNKKHNKGTIKHDESK